MRLQEEFTHRTGATTAGFTSTDLIATLATVVLAGLLFVPVLGRENDASHRAVCLANLRQIMAAVTMYSPENGDSLPHPGWGSVDGTANAGPDSWAYATANNGRVPGGPAYIPSTYGKRSDSNQLPFYAVGQLARYLPGQQVLMCPTDLASARTVGTYAQWYMQRNVKLTSYTMNAGVCGYGGGKETSTGRPYQADAFGPSDLLFWEVDERNPFNFNDAGSNPSNTAEGPSQRHSGVEPTSLTVEILGAVGHVGRADGSADRLPVAAFRALRANGGRGRANELLCGPGFE